MKRLCSAALLLIPLVLNAQATTQGQSSASIHEKQATLLAVVNDWAYKAGYTGGWHSAPPPNVPVELLAVVTASGDWIDPTLHCRVGDNTGCSEFLEQYLNRAKDYTILTSPGRGSTVHVELVDKLDDCYGFSSTGSLSSSVTGDAAIASDHPTLFDTSPTWQSTSRSEIAIVRAGLLRLGPKKVKEFDGVQVRKIQIDGQMYFVAERHSTAHRSSGIVFSIGRINQGHFYLLRWNEEGGEDGDTIESALGVIRLKNGREFLLTTESDPEGQRFYAYGIRNGRLQIVFRGGGSSC
jgi:hypothetical protein